MMDTNNGIRKTGGKRHQQQRHNTKEITEADARIDGDITHEDGNGDVESAIESEI